MKINWNIFGLVVLLMQVFSPLVGVAETIKEVNSFELTKITAQSDKNGSASSFIVEIFGEALTQESETKNITVSENFKITNLNGNVTDLAGQEIGSYQVNQNQLNLILNPNLNGPIKLSISGELINPTISEQMITMTNEMKSVTTQVTIATKENPIAPSKPNEPASPQPEAPLIPETPIVPITEATEKFETIAPKREAIDIQTLFPSTSGQTSLITSMTINDENGNPIDVTTIGDFLKFNLDFSLPEDIRTQMQAGDYFEFSLPDQIKISQNQSFPLTNLDGVQYATATIGVDGKVRITFNGKVTEESDIFGNFNFEGELDLNNLTGTGPNHIDTPFVDNQPGIDITVKPDVTSSVDKKGAFDKIPNPNKVTWNVDINKALDEITNASLTEAIPDGLTFETVKIYQVTVDLKGKVIEGSEVLVDPSEYTVDATGNVTFKNKINGAYRLIYETTINDDKKPGAEGGAVKFENKVTFDGDEIAPILATASVTASYKKALEKGKPGYNPDKQTFDWTINYNFTEYKIKESQATVSDTINGNMSLLSDSVILNKVTFDDKGNAIEGAPLILGQDYTLVPKADGKGFDIQFNQDIDYAVAIHYTTKVNDVIDQDTDYSNTVEDGSGNQDSETGHAKQQGLIKNVDYVDNGAKTINWVIDVNKNNYQMENWTLTDQLSAGLELVDRQFVIQNMTKGGIPLEVGQDYTFVYDRDTNRITVAFINSYLNTSDTFTIHYKTHYDFEAMAEAGETTFYNNASSDWVSTTDNTHKNPGDTAEFLPNEESGNNGFKFGEYNAVSKTITWTLGVNYSRVGLENAKVSDPITGNQKYIPGSLKVFKYQITPDGGYVKGAEVIGSDFEKFGITEPSASNNQTLTIAIPDGPQTNQYLFEYQTSLVGEIIKDSSEYDNTATTTNNGHQDYDVTGTVSIANGGSFADKSGKQDADGFVNWSATVNPSQSTISNVVVNDNPSTNQVIDENSIVVYHTSVAEDGKITKTEAVDPAEYTVSLSTDSITGSQHLQVAFTNTLTTSYILEYRSMVFIESGNSGKVNNDLTVTGLNGEEINGGDSSEVSVNVSNGGGTIVGTKGSLTLRKTNDQNTSLTGASFELWDQTNTQKLREGQVAQDGTLKFGQLPYGTYLLKEIKAPIGYTIPDDLISGRKVTIDKTSSTEGQLLSIVDDESAVTLLKQSTTGQNLAGATFRLETLLGSIWIPILANQTFTTDTNGKLIVKGLDEGRYRFIETKAPITPKEYVLNTMPIEFEVTRAENGQIKPLTVGPYLNYLGSAVFEKQDATGNPLENAEFSVKRVRNGSGGVVNETVATGIKSDSAGAVHLAGLSPGIYEVSETAAPTGYLKNTEKLTFTIVSQASNEPVEIDAGNFKNYQGSLTFVKKNQVGNLLAGAMFKVQDSNGTTVQENLTSTSQGVVNVTNLAPGNYELIETAAPTGYILNTEKIPFDIANEAAGEPNPVVLKDVINYRGSVSLTKINSQEAKLPDAEFTLYAAGNDVSLGVFKSNADGKIAITDLAPGDYRLVETKAPLQENGESYIRNEYPVNFTIPNEFAGEIGIQELGDYQNFRGKLVLSKEDGAGGGALAGATFELYGLGTSTPIQALVTDSTGALDYGLLAPGFYRLVEIKAPPGYIINKNPIFFVVTDDESNDTEDNFSFKNYQSSVQFNKTNEAGDVLTDAEFKIVQKTDSTGNEVDLTIVEGLKANDENLYYYEGLEEGTYELIETKAATGYLLNTQPVEFKIEPAFNQPETLVLDDFINYQGSISFTKTDELGNGLAGAEFSLYNEQNETVLDSEGNAIKPISGIDGQVQIDQLAPGNYILKEDKAPIGYLVNQKNLTFTITNEATGKPEVQLLDNYINYQGSIQFKKANNQQEGLNGAEFKLYDAKGNNVKRADGELISVISGADGKVSLEHLAPGDYILKETKAPVGYVLSQKEIRFTIASEAIEEPDVAVLLDFINYEGTISFIKTNQAGQGLANAEFSLFDEAGKVVVDKAGKDIKAVSGEDGKVIMEHLAPGNYQLKEMKAPVGYLINQKSIPFTIVQEAEAEPKVVELADFKNYQGTIQLTKVDAEIGGKSLSGAVFNVTDATGEIVKEQIVTNEKGQLKVDKLAPGTYYFVETKAPTGYQLSPKKYEVTIPNQAMEEPQAIAVTIKNERIKTAMPDGVNGKSDPSQFPKAGEKQSLTMLWLGISALGISFILWYYWLRKNINKNRI